MPGTTARVVSSSGTASSRSGIRRICTATTATNASAATRAPPITSLLLVMSAFVAVVDGRASYCRARRYWLKVVVRRSLHLIEQRALCDGPAERELQLPVAAIDIAERE